MRSTSTCTILFLLTFISTMEAQHYALQLDVELSKSHQIYVDHDKKTEWKEIDHTTVKKSNHELSKTNILKSEIEIQKIKQYQKGLLALGYNLKATGTADDTMIKAYCKHLKRIALLS